ncbi:nucleolar pre-ribosomal-associated protein 2 [Dichotomopilus funicola]|uniref:Nucleolar pre-ribosomal-associated protein 2 n=1 Tax=Dichotomopilus funicola TaxID=1934379 RepID=A0AAN6V2X0_9PEZI|nr:nucleolar pre-ribosomal-associated protein 2 [Dichotomopilus funicola]
MPENTVRSILYVRILEAALVRAVRGLDHGDIDTIPDRLERVWDILEDYPGGSFHAAEEMLLRWLLKNMTGSSPAAGRVRRYHRVWDILSAVFASIPLSFLAKTLADRRFVGLLQQTLNDIAVPQREEQPQKQTGGAYLDIDMPDAPAPESPTNPRKRKRLDGLGFDPASQKQMTGCLHTAEAVFEAVRVLLSQCELKSMDGPMTHKMGAEHVKALFSTTAAETMGVMVPWITVCELAVDGSCGGLFREQSSWVSTLSALWELHLQSATDASEVATHLSATASRLLGKLTGIPQQISLGIEVTVQERWARDIRRFLARNLVLPARASFLAKEGQDVMKLAVELASASAQITFPVLFDLASKAPLEIGGKASRKDYETWTQSVFDAVVLAVNNVNRDARLPTVKGVMAVAADRASALSADSLRSVCSNYALRKETCDWDLLLAIIKLNADVFLVTDQGEKLLDTVLAQTREPDSLGVEDSIKAVQFIVLLANGYAQARDLSTFVQLWLKQLEPVKAKNGPQPLWAQKELSETVTDLVRSSLNSSQLIEILEWLSSRTQPTESMARIHILEALSGGISTEEFIDAASIKTFEGAFLEKPSKKDLPAVAACRWNVASQAISKGTLEEANQIWTRIRPDIKSALRKGPTDRIDTFAAFKCCVGAWIANYRTGENEDDTASMVYSFLERLRKEHEASETGAESGEPSLNMATYITWVLSDAPRVFSLLVEKSGNAPDVVLSFLAMHKTEEAAKASPTMSIAPLILERESILKNQGLMDLLIKAITMMIDTSKKGRSDLGTMVAIHFLLRVPIEIFNRNQREAVMKALVSQLPGDAEKVKDGESEYWTPALSLMVKLMERPTFYEGMSFSHLESIGRCLLKAHKRSGKSEKETLRARSDFKLLYELATSVIRQMTNGSPEERENDYLRDAILLLQSPCQNSEAAARIVLLHAFISAVQVLPAAKKSGEDGLDTGILKNQLIQLATPVVTSEKKATKGLLALLIALDALNPLSHEDVRPALAAAAPSLLEASDVLLGEGLRDGWEVRMFLANHFPEVLTSPLKIDLAADASPALDGEKAESGSPAILGKTALLRYVDAVIGPAEEDTKLKSLEEFVTTNCPSESLMGNLLVTYRLIQHLKGSRPSTSPVRFDLAQANSRLCDQLVHTTVPAHFLLCAKAIQLILDQNPACMTQWNIEHSLSTVSAISDQAPTQILVSTTPAVYPALCRLVEVVIKRHRKRLDGHFHILIMALQALLRLLLLSPPIQPTPTTTTPTTTTITTKPTPTPQEKHAKLFSRLLTLICEPTASSVSRSSQSSTTTTTTATAPAGGALDSERDRAKRYAGQFMYLVLMQYIRLQLSSKLPGGTIPHKVREALEPGVYAILDITTRDGLRIMNDGMDGGGGGAGGRVVLREMYKGYEKFGKWSGV